MDNKLKPDYSPKFLQMVSQVIAHETGGDKSGAYTHDPSDPGGETKWGISKRSYPHLNIKALTFNDAVALYYKDFYTGMDTILDNRLAFKLFDMSVLNGRVKAIKLFQRAIRALGGKIKVDGYLGPVTIEAANHCDPRALYVKFQELINNRFNWIAILRPSSKRYLKGWKSRLYFNFDTEDIA